jgi:hypothetical protein
VGALIREAIDEKLARVQDVRAEAFRRLLEAEPVPVDDWPVMKKEILDSHYAKVEKLYGEDE